MAKKDNHSENHSEHTEVDQVKNNGLMMKNQAKRVWEYAVKYRVILLLIIPLFLSIFLRIQPVYLPMTDTWAQDNVQHYYSNQISQQINQQYPNLPEANRQTLIQAQLEKVYAGDSQQNIQKQIDDLSANFKSRFKDEDGQTYLLAIDPYVFYRLTKNYVNHGYPGEIEKDGISYDVLRDGRNLREQPPQFHAWLMSKLHELITIFNPSMSVMGSVFYFPVIISALAVIPAFLLARRIGGDIGGFFASVLVAVHPAVLGRTAAGFADTDSYNLLFPLLIAWLFMESLESKDLIKKYIYSILSGLSVGIYVLAWGGWWYVYDFILAAMGGYLLLIGFRYRKNLKEMLKQNWQESALKNSLYTSGLFVLFSNIGILFTNMSFQKYSFAYSLQLLTHFIKLPLAFTTYKAVAVTDIWPNVLTTVAELNLASSNQVINQIGGKIFFTLAILGMVFVVFSREKFDTKRALYIAGSTVWLLFVFYLREHVSTLIFLVASLLPPVIALFLIDNKKSIMSTKYALLLIVWFAATFYAAMRGMRFSALIVPGFALTMGSGIGVIYLVASDWFSKAIDLNPKIVKVVVGVLLLLLLVNPIRGGYSTAINEIPSMNDAWYNSLIGIKEDSNDSIITSWWDFGHWFTAIAERRVTFDGGSQGRRIHWVGKTLLTDNEDEAIGILRMLNCDQERAYDKAVNGTKGDKLKAINMLYDSFTLDAKGAKKLYLKNGLSEDEANSLIKSTHCKPMTQYYIASEDMVGKSGVWAHFGGWDFTRGSMWNKVRPMKSEEGVKTLVNDYGLDKSTAEQYYYEIQTTDADKWVSSWPSFASGVGACSVDGDIAKCATGLVLDSKTGDATVNTQQGSGHPYSLVYMNSNNEFTEKLYDNPVFQYSAAMFVKDGVPNSVFMDKKLAKSMFVRLFFFRGEGLKHFELLSKKRQVTGGDIYVYKVNWEPKPENLTSGNFTSTTEVTNEVSEK